MPRRAAWLDAYVQQEDFDHHDAKERQAQNGFTARGQNSRAFATASGSMLRG
jgi:hypothetical protein